MQHTSLHHLLFSCNDMCTQLSGSIPTDLTFKKTFFFLIKSNKLILIQKLLKILGNSTGTRELAPAPTRLMLTLCFGRNEKTVYLYIQYNVYEENRLEASLRTDTLAPEALPMHFSNLHSAFRALFST